MEKIDKEKSIVYNKWSDTVSLNIKGTFVDDFNKPEDYYEGTLWQIRADDESPFGDRYGNCFKYFVPRSTKVVEPKKLRPFKDIKEFRHILGVKVGNIIHYREKGSSLEYNLMWTGYTNDKLVVIFGGTFHSLNSLFERYEYCDSKGEWHPFGVEE